MPRQPPEWTSRPTSSLDGKEMLAIYRGRKHIATLRFAAPGGDNLDELVVALEHLWNESTKDPFK